MLQDAVRLSMIPCRLGFCLWFTAPEGRKEHEAEFYENERDHDEPEAASRADTEVAGQVCDALGGCGIFVSAWFVPGGWRC